MHIEMKRNEVELQHEYERINNESKRLEERLMIYFKLNSTQWPLAWRRFLGRFAPQLRRRQNTRSAK
jgi:hypothetical protein